MRKTKIRITKKALKSYINTENRPISRNLSINVNGNNIHRRNLNMLVVGGSGAGKTQFLARPVLMQQSGSFVITDPKGEILQTCGQMLKDAGYRILVLNILDAIGMAKSTHYNPFVYIKSETDLLKLITNLFENTKQKNEGRAENPFWDNSAKMLLQALMFYVWMECPEKKRNFRMVMELLEKAEFSTDIRGNKLPSELDIMFEELEERTIAENEAAGRKMICRHPAVIAYNKIMRGAPDTVRCIIQTLNSRLVYMTNDILSVLDDDEFDIPQIGAGADYDGKTKTAVFCVIPDTDRTYNFVIGMFYTQMFQQLYFYADFISGERKLPIHITFLLDEFANVALPDDYLSYLSTMRGRNISSIIIIQNFAQIKNMYKENLWENIPGNCDVILYLGGNEQGSREYITKELGEGTYDKDTHGVTHGANGSSSMNYDKFGRKLLTESEVREIDDSECLIFIRGFKPLKDKKYDTFNHPLWYKVANANFMFDARKVRKAGKAEEAFRLVSSKMFNAYRNKERYENELLDDSSKVHRVFEFSYEEFMAADESILDVSDIYNATQLARNRELLEERTRRAKEDTIEGIAGAYLQQVMKLRQKEFSFEQIKALMPLIEKGMRIEKIEEVFSKNMQPDELEAYTKLFV